MKRPFSASRSAPQAYLASRNGLVSSSAISRSQSSSGNSATGATCWMPAFATTPSRPPKRSIAASTATRLPARVVRSASNGWPGPWGSGSRSTARTSAPSASSRAAIARPMPLPAPVTSAVRMRASYPERPRISAQMAAREGKVLWEPGEELLRDSKMARYMAARGLSSYEELWRWSIEDLEGFWRSLWELYDVGPAPEHVLARAEMPEAKWIPGTE